MQNVANFIKSQLHMLVLVTTPEAGCYTFETQSCFQDLVRYEVQSHSFPLQLHCSRLSQLQLHHRHASIHAQYSHVYSSPAGHRFACHQLRLTYLCMPFTVIQICPEGTAWRPSAVITLSIFSMTSTAPLPPFAPVLPLLDACCCCCCCCC